MAPEGIGSSFVCLYFNDSFHNYQEGECEFSKISYVISYVFSINFKIITYIRSKTKNIFKKLLNFVYALHLTQELEKKDEVIRMEQLKSYLIEQYEAEDSVTILSDSESEKSSSSTEISTPIADIINEPNILLKEEREVKDSEVKEIPSPDEQTQRNEKLPLDLVCLPMQSKPSTDSNISPPVKKQKLESEEISEIPKKSGIFKRSIVNKRDEPFKKPKSNIFMKSEIPKLNLKTLHIRQSNNYQIRAPPSSPVSTLSPRNRKVSDVNVPSIRSGIFDARKRFLEKPKSDRSNSGSDRSSNSKKSVAIVDGKGNIKYVHKDNISTLTK